MDDLTGNLKERKYWNGTGMDQAFTILSEPAKSELGREGFLVPY